MNTPLWKLVENTEHACRNAKQFFLEQEAHEGEAVIICGGPSLKEHLDDIRSKSAQGAILFATNNTLNWLKPRGIKPHFFAMCDARPENLYFVENAPRGTTYLIGAQSDPAILRTLENRDTITWFPTLGDQIAELSIISKYPHIPIMYVGGGETIGLKTMLLAYFMGFREMTVVGMDSCYNDGHGHAYKQALNEDDKRLTITYNHKVYSCAPWMIRQAQQFEHQVPLMNACRVEVLGKGLIPDMAREI